MEKKILIAVDDSRAAKNTIHYAVSASHMVEELHYVLFHVQPGVSSFLQQEARSGGKARKQLENILDQNEKSARTLIENYREDMVKMGIPSDRIECITRKRDLGVAKDILDFAKEKRYDAIVVGRRGLSRLAEMYAGSVTSDILEQSRVTPVWLVDGKVKAGTILLAVDGSESSLRAVDHISFFLAHNPKATLTFLHVTSNARQYCEVGPGAQPDNELEEIFARGDKACIDNFYSHAMKMLNGAGVPANRIKTEFVKGGRRIGKSVLDHAVKNNFNTIVVGRRGIDTSFFMGSVSRHIVNKISDASVWVVP